MRILKKALKIILRVFYVLLPYNRFGDKIFYYIRFLRKHKRFPSGKMLFNDFIFKIMTSDEILQPERVFTSDKELVKIYIAQKVGDEYNIPTIAVLKTIKEIEDFIFPKRCVIKPTHSSGRIIFRKNGENIDFKKIREWLSHNYYRESREANYKYLKPKVIVEKFVSEVVDYVDDIKFFCYQGKVKLIQYDFDRYTNHTRKLYTKNWEDLNISMGYPLSSKKRIIWKNLKKMVEIVERLAENFSFVRVDLYSDKDRFFIGEISHIHGNATEIFFPLNGEKKVSDLIFASD